MEDSLSCNPRPTFFWVELYGGRWTTLRCGCSASPALSLAWWTNHLKGEGHIWPNVGPKEWYVYICIYVCICTYIHIHAYI